MVETSREVVKDRTRDRRDARRGLLVRVLYPVHWSFLISQVALWSFLILAVTGLFLLVFYRPGLDPVTYRGSASLYAGLDLPRAFVSVLTLNEDIPLGDLVRRVHEVATYVFIGSLVLHGLRVVLTGAFRAPRRGNYLLGVVLLLVAIGVAYTGHLLPYDVYSGASLRITYTLVASVPFIGEQTAVLVFGDDGVWSSTALVRFWILHVAVLPLLLVGGLVLHLLLVARNRHTRLPGTGGHRLALVDPLRQSLVIGLGTLGVVLLVSALAPWGEVRLAGPHEVGYVINSLQPAWFMFWPEGAMRILPGVELEIGPLRLTSAFLVGAALPGLLLLPVLALPFVGARRHRGRSRDELDHPFGSPLRFGLVIGWLTIIAVLSTGAVDNVLAEVLRVPVSNVVVALRVALIVLPPAAGALAWYYAKRQGDRWGRRAHEDDPDHERSERTR